MKTAVKPAVSRSATGTSASSSRLRALIWLRVAAEPWRWSASPALALARPPWPPAACRPPPCCRRRPLAVAGRRRRRRRSAGGAGSGSTTSPSRSSISESASSRQRSSWSVTSSRRSSGTEAAWTGPSRPRSRGSIAERQVVGQAAVERDPAALVDAEEVDLAGAVDGGDADAGDDQRAPTSTLAAVRSAGAAARLAARLAAPLAARGRGADPLGRDARLLGARADQRRALLDGDVVGLLEAEGDDGDVVAAAGLVGLARRAARRPRRGSRAASRIAAISLVLDHRRQAVRAEQEDVAGAGAEASSCRPRPSASGPSARVMIERCG